MSEGLRIIQRASVHFTWKNPALKQSLVMEEGPFVPESLKTFVASLKGEHRYTFFDLMKVWKKEHFADISAEAQEWYNNLPLRVRVLARAVDFTIDGGDEVIDAEFDSNGVDGNGVVDDNPLTSEPEISIDLDFIIDDLEPAVNKVLTVLIEASEWV